MTRRQRSEFGQVMEAIYAATFRLSDEQAVAFLESVVKKCHQHMKGFKEVKRAVAMKDVPIGGDFVFHRTFAISERGYRKVSPDSCVDIKSLDGRMNAWMAGRYEPDRIVFMAKE